MINIHSTKKLFAKLPLTEGGMLANARVNTDTRVESDSPLGDWHANLLSIQGHSCILFIHDTTRFPVFLKELRKPDFAELAWHFEDGFMNTLLKAGANDAQMQAAANALRPLQFDSECNRSVQSAGTQRAGDIEYMLVQENLPLSEISAYRTGAWLSEMLTKVKGMKDYIRPNEAMFTLLDELAQTPHRKTTDTGRENVVSIAKFRK